MLLLVYAHQLFSYLVLVFLIFRLGLDSSSFLKIICLDNISLPLLFSLSECQARTE